MQPEFDLAKKEVEAMLGRKITTNDEVFTFMAKEEIRVAKEHEWRKALKLNDLVQINTGGRIGQVKRITKKKLDILVYSSFVCKAGKDENKRVERLETITVSQDTGKLGQFRIQPMDETFFGLSEEAFKKHQQDHARTTVWGEFSEATLNELWDRHKWAKDYWGVK